MPIESLNEPHPLLVALVNQNASQLLAKGRVIHVSHLAPIGKSLVVAVNPFNGPLLEYDVLFAGGVLDFAKVDDGFVPCLSEDSYGQVFLRPNAS